MTDDTPVGVENKPLPLGVAYIAGPMRGLPQFNFPAFMEAERILVAQGWEVRNPATHDIDMGFDPRTKKGTNEELDEFDLLTAAAWDLEQIVTECDAVVLLPGWKQSRGAKAEYAVAKWTNKVTYEFDRSSSTGTRFFTGEKNLDV